MDALNAFHFLRPWWLLAIPLWLWLSVYVWRKGHGGDGWAEICDPALLSYLVGETDKQQRSRLSIAVLMLAGCLACMALAGPVWQQLPQPVYRAQSGLVIGLDLSRSMLAEDLKPNRLQRAKQKLQDILSVRREGQTALVVFAGAAFDVVPLTSDNKAILAMLDALEPSMMPAQGSRASTALGHAQAIFKRSAIKRGTVLLLTDGVDSEALSLASHMVRKGHSVSIIGVGTENGAPIPAGGDASGFVKDAKQNIVISRLQTGMLRQLADAGHGVYQAIQFDDADINAIPGLKPSASDLISKQEKLQTDLWREEGSWLLLLVLPLLSLAFRRGVLLSLMLLPLVMSPNNAQAMAWKDLWQSPDQQGQALMREKKPGEASQLFQNPDWKGAALYRAKKYKQAADALSGVDHVDGWYNRGNALAKAGDLKGALDAYDHALKLDKTDKDVQFNRDLVKKAMQQSKKKKSKDQKKSDQQKKDDQKKDKQDKKQQGKDGGKGKDQAEQKSSRQKKAQKKQAEQEKQQQAKTKQQGKQKSEQHAAQPGKQEESEQDKEKNAALQQWLRRIPDDPGGLLRRKFQYQYQQQGQQQNQSNGAGDKAW